MTSIAAPQLERNTKDEGLLREITCNTHHQKKRRSPYARSRVQPLPSLLNLLQNGLLAIVLPSSVPMTVGERVFRPLSIRVAVATVAAGNHLTPSPLVSSAREKLACRAAGPRRPLSMLPRPQLGRARGSAVGTGLSGPPSADQGVSTGEAQAANGREGGGSPPATLELGFLGPHEHKQHKPLSSDMTKKSIETQLQKPFFGAFKILADDDEDDECDDKNDEGNNMNWEESEQPALPLNASVLNSNYLNFGSCDDLNMMSSGLEEDTVIRRFVGSTVVGEPEVENAYHHGLVDATINLKEAMDDINSMFGKPINFVRGERPKRKQGNASINQEPAVHGFSIYIGR